MGKERVLLENRIELALIRRQRCDVFSVKEDSSFVWFFKAGNNSEGRCLSAARWAQKSDEITILDIKCQVVYGNDLTPYHLVGLDRDGILHVGSMSGRDAVANGIQWAVSFVTHDGLASSLIINGEIQRQNLGGGVNPRTALGQRDDGALLLLVLDGRSINTLGATMEDVVNIMLEYGAVNAGNLDGGSSSVMVYDGEIVNHCASVTGPRRIPTGFIVLKEGVNDD